MAILAITTTGTSLLTNQDDRPWAGWRRGQALPGKEEVQHWLSNLADEKLVQASAELHTWYRLGVFNPEGERYTVSLVHSQTEEGRFCAEVLADYAHSRGIDAEPEPVDHLHYTTSEEFNKGLSNLVKTLSSLIAKGKNQGGVLLAATGGFKAEIAVANLVGALLDCDVYYIYEQFQELIRIEPLPIDLARNWVTQGPIRGLMENIFKDSDGPVPVDEVYNFLQQDPQIDRLLEHIFIDGTEYVALNSLGSIAKEVLQQPVEEWPSPSDRTPQEKIQLSGVSHHRPRQTEAIIQALARNPYTTRIRFDPQGSYTKGVRPADDNTSDIIVVFGDENLLRLRVSTTAQDDAQRSLVLHYIKRILRDV